MKITGCPRERDAGDAYHSLLVVIVFSALECPCLIADVKALFLNFLSY
jgi:hypothetical protein